MIDQLKFGQGGFGLGSLTLPLGKGKRYLASAGVKIFGMGDSITDRHHDPQAAWTSTGERSNTGKGALVVARMRSPRFKFYAYYDASSTITSRARSGTNFGVSGETTTQMLARINNLIAKMADGDVFYLAGGTNDLPAGISAETTLSNINAMIAAVRAAKPNSPVILNTIRARAATADALAYGIDATQLATLKAVNDGIRAYCAARSWCRLCDIYYAYKAAGSDYSDNTLLEDGLHPNTMGIGIEAVDYLTPVINGLIRPGSTIETGTNLWAFPFGTPGGDTANGGSGTVPAGLRVTRTVASGSTTVVSSLVTDGGIDKVQLDFTVGGTAVEQFRLAANNTFNGVTIPAGAWLKFMVDVEVEDKQSVCGVQVELYRDNTTTIRSVGAKYQPVVGNRPKSYRGSYTISSEALPSDGTTTFSSLARMVVAVDGNVGGTLRVKFSNPRLIVVPDPSTI